MNRATTTQIADYKKRLLKNLRGKRRKKLQEAINFAEKFTKGKTRGNGEPEIIHPLFTACKTAQAGLGLNSICAALLHDLIEDNPDIENMPQLIEQSFGSDVLGIVTALTKLETPKTTVRTTNNIHSIQKYLLATTKDLRVMIIKLAGRLHSLITVEGLKPNHRLNYCRQIRDLYIPIARHLGLWFLKKELEDTLLMKTKPRVHSKLKSFTEEYTKKQSEITNGIEAELKKICTSEKIEAHIYGRVKSLSAMYDKMRKLKLNISKIGLDKIQDIIAFRAIVNTTQDCYVVLHLVKKYYGYNEDTIYDFIEKPKSNGYRSLHITLEHPSYGHFELQIRTPEMHYFNEYGPAAHFAYKQAENRDSKPTTEFQWTRRTCEMDFRDFEDKPIQLNLFKKEIFVLTPKKEIIQLPKNATVIDFAYALHTELGNKCIGAKVNRRPVRIDTILKTGDVVEILTSDKQKYPSKSWLEFVVSDSAKRKIREAVNRRRIGL